MLAVAKVLVRACAAAALGWLDAELPRRAAGAQQKGHLGTQHLHCRTCGCGLLHWHRLWNGARHGHFLLASLALRWCHGWC